MSYCSYFQAIITKKDTWFFVATLRGNEHIAFDRSYDKEVGMFEFFVPQENEEKFIALMKQYEQIGILANLEKLPNRLMTEEF